MIWTGRDRQSTICSSRNFLFAFASSPCFKTFGKCEVGLWRTSGPGSFCQELRVTRYRRANSRFVCQLLGNEDSGKTRLEPSHESQSLRFFVTYESWRNPTWLRESAQKYDGSVLESNSHETPPPFFRVPNEHITLRLACTAVSLSLFGLFTFASFRLDSYAQKVAKETISSSLDRELQIGRVARCNPFTGLKLRNVSLSPSLDHPTAPVVSGADIDVKIAGILKAIFLRRALRVDVVVHNAVVHLSQVVVEGSDGLPYGQWDSGVYPGTVGSDKHRSDPAVYQFLEFFQPGSFSVRNADVHLQPADFLDYGHGSETVVIKETSAVVQFPTFKAPEQGSSQPFTMDGDFEASVKGLPAQGGSVNVQCRLNGNTYFDLRSEDVAVSVHFTGERVQAGQIASFLSLPFRAEEGSCSVDVDIDLLHKSESPVPLIRGEAQLNSVALRFNPDPATPEFRNVAGKLRFEGKTVYFDGPLGDLGTLPMTVVGNIHLEEGYNLMGYVKPVDVNNIITTFAIDNFVPVSGLVSGEAQLSGSLEEPIITGWAETVSQNAVLDQIPVRSANFSFEWDSIGGLLSFTDIRVAAKGGGIISGTGNLYFDMTQESSYGSSPKLHSPRSPKAVYWNPKPNLSKVSLLQPLPADELEIDEQAPYRPYDSMRFDLNVTEFVGGDLLKWYGGEYGQIATQAIGLVSAEIVLAGHVEDANFRINWRSTTLPPEVSRFSPDSTTEKPASTSSPTVRHSSGKRIEDSDPSAGDNTLRKKNARSAASQDSTGSTNAPEGGEFRGLAYLKMGDLPEARRVKIRTVVKNFDARRVAWADPKFQQVLSNAPLTNFSADAYFKGIISQRPTLLDCTLSRKPAMEMVGLDGALAVQNLALNNNIFEKVMNGSFSVSSSDFSVSLKEVTDRSNSNPTKSENADVHSDFRVLEDAGDEITVSGSNKGAGRFCFRLGDSEINAILSKDSQNHQVGTVFARNVPLEDFIGEDHTFSGGEPLAGLLNISMNLDFSASSGEGNISLQRPRMGPMTFSSIKGNVLWKNEDLFLDSARVKYLRSEYQIDARYSRRERGEGPALGWEVNVGIPAASIRDVAKLVQSGNTIATAMQSPADKVSRDRPRTSGGPLWIQKLSRSSERDGGSSVMEWAVPDGLSLSEEVKWFQSYLHEEKEVSKRFKPQRYEEKSVSTMPSSAGIEGELFGRVSIRYDSQSGEKRTGSTNANALLEATLDQLARASFSFELEGADWKVADVALTKINASGTFEDGVLTLGPVSVQGEDDFSFETQARVTSAGSIQASAQLQHAPADLFREYGRGPVSVTGRCSGRLEVDGNLANPRIFGKAIWTGATLNGKGVKGAKTDLACVNGRCLLNMGARIGGRPSAAQKDADRVIFRSLKWGEPLVSGLRDFASHISRRPEELKENEIGGKKDDSSEVFQVRISAPVQFYVLQYLQRRTPSPFRNQIGSVLGGSIASDDEWVLVDVNAKRYGLILMNTLVPELGWRGGDCDIFLRVSGTLQEPVIKGRVSISDGRLFPEGLADPIQGLKGEIEFNENGLVSLNSISGRCSGKSLSGYGDLFISESHQAEVQESLTRNEHILDYLDARDEPSKQTQKWLQSERDGEKLSLQKAERGLTLEFGDLPLHLQNVITSNLSGTVRVLGTVNSPVFGGKLTFSEGIVFLGNSTGAPQGALGSQVVKDDALAEALRTNMGNAKTSRPLSSAPDGSKVAGQTAPKNMATFTQERSSKAGFNIGDVVLNKFRVDLGRDMQVVQPFLLNIDTAGSIVVNGKSSRPEVDGEIKVLGGNVNMFATRMSVRKKEDNFVRFMTSANRSGLAMPEPIIQMTLEDKDLVVRIPECRMSTWAQHLVFTDKSGANYGSDNLSEMVASQLRGARSPYGMARLLARYAGKSFAANGKVGLVEWKAYPALVNRLGGLQEGRLRNEIGLGVGLEGSRFGVAGSAAVDGTLGAKVGVHLGEWVNWDIEVEGCRTTSELKLKMRLKEPKQVDDTVVESRNPRGKGRVVSKEQENSVEPSRKSDSEQARTSVSKVEIEKGKLGTVASDH